MGKKAEFVFLDYSVGIGAKFDGLEKWLKALCMSGEANLSPSAVRQQI